MRITIPIPITPRIIEEWKELLISQPVLFFGVCVGLVFVFLFINKARMNGFKK